MRADEGGQLIFAKLRQLENATTRNAPSERLSACSDLFDAVIRVDQTYGAVLQRVKQEYDDAFTGGLALGGSGGVDGADGNLAENYANLSVEYQRQREHMDSQALEFKILSEQYEIVLRQKERLAQEHEAHQQTILEQQESIASLEKAAEMTNAAALIGSPAINPEMSAESCCQFPCQCSPSLSMGATNIGRACAI